MDPKIIALYDEYTHAPLPRRVFLERLVALAGSSAAAAALLPMLDNNYANAAVVEPNDSRIGADVVRIALPGGTMAAYVATPKDGPARRGGIVVIHENRGLNPHIRDIARRLAVAGFTAAAVDMLYPQGGTPADEDKAREMFSRVDRNAAVRDLAAVVDWMKARPDSNGKVGVVGFCWGGAMANLLATASPALVAAVPFYGSAPPTSDVAKIRAKLLIHYAGNDPRINASWPDYDAALKAANVDHRAFFYEGTEHGFNNDTAGARYNAAAADLAWKRTLAFFEANLTT
ncbi:MAG: dienelactone hydrolase family protein [Burkholderiales bacterium]|nr:dienelactone hydrolase family protein [Burkholderiales bacterium]